eukprot:10327320-Alexandrium_andersonii.AAC.1
MGSAQGPLLLARLLGVCLKRTKHSARSTPLLADPGAISTACLGNAAADGATADGDDLDSARSEDTGAESHDEPVGKAPDVGIERPPEVEVIKDDGEASLWERAAALWI